MSPSKARIFFHYQVPQFYFPNRQIVKASLLSIFKDHSKVPDVINYIFCSDKYLLALNKKHLHHNFYTDILTFQLNEEAESLLADVYISIERARDNAHQFKVPLQHEILRLLIHGTLHLCGHRDTTTAEKDNMTQLENLFLKKLFHV